jgi:hypothetical protein
MVGAGRHVVILVCANGGIIAVRFVGNSVGVALVGSEL